MPPDMSAYRESDNYEKGGGGFGTFVGVKDGVRSRAASLVLKRTGLMVLHLRDLSRAPKPKHNCPCRGLLQ